MAIDKDKIGQVLSESDLKSIEQGLRDIGVSAKDTLSIMTAQRAENERLKKTLEEVKEVQDRINKINLKGNDIIDQTNKIIEARIEKEGKITKWTEDRISNLEYIHKTGNEDLSIAEKRAKIQDRAAQVENDMANSRNKKGQFNKGYNQDIEKGLKIDHQVLEAQDKALALELAQTDAVQERTDAMMNGLRSVTDFINKMPGGKLLTSSLGFGEKDMQKISGNLGEWISGSRDFKDVFKGTEKATAGTALKLGLAAASIGIAVGLFKIFHKFLKMSSEVTDELGRNFGVMGAQSPELKKAFDGALPGAIKLGASTKDLTEIVGELSNNFGMSMNAATGVMDEVLNTSVAMGITNQEGAKLFGYLMQGKGMSAEMAKESLDFAYNLAAANDVNPSAVMQDMAQSMETVSKFGGENLENLAEAAVKAKKYGMSLDDVGKIGESLLNFQSSIRAEQEAQMILGQDLNFQKARELALSNDLSGMMSEITSQLGDKFYWNQMNFFERSSLAKVLGVEVSTMERLVKEQQGLITPAKTFSELMGEDAMSNLTKLMNQFKSIGAELMKRVAPTLEVMLEKLDNWVQSGGWQQVLGFVQSIANALLWMINNKEIIGAILGAMMGFAVGGPLGALVGGMGGGLLMSGVPSASPLPEPVETADSLLSDPTSLAQGGKFVTSGPTNVLVGDNPGGKELVTAIPLNSSGAAIPSVVGQGGGNQMDINTLSNSIGQSLTSANKVSNEKLDKLINIMDTAFGLNGTVAREIGRQAGRNVGRKMGTG